MIFYFSGIGNTRYAANRIASITGEKLYFIPELDPLVQSFTGDSLGFMFPIYSWGVPPIVLEFIARLPEKFVKEVQAKNIPVWMVCTCGDETGNAPEMLRKAVGRRGLELKGTWSVIMPNTYVLLPGFDVDSPELEKEKLKKAEKRIKEIGEKIKRREWISDVHKGSLPALRTVLLFPLFKRWGINPERWHHTEACVKCGRCVQACPVHNICMTENGPVWGINCLSCLACYHVCPYHAVEYGKITRNKGQYVCPLNSSRMNR